MERVKKGQNEKAYNRVREAKDAQKIMSTSMSISRSTIWSDAKASGATMQVMTR